MMEVVRWGEIEYSQAQSQQLQLLEDIAAGKTADTVVLCTHPPVVTLGRGTQAGDAFGWQGQIADSTRGGRATYHGPNQLVIYPLLNLAIDRKGMAPRDLHAYLRALEKATVLALREIGLDAEAKTLLPGGGGPSMTGVWVGDHKIASIGIAVKKWVSYHGVAINVDHDPQAFTGINPCGFSTDVMTSVENLLGKKVDRVQFENICGQAFKACLS